MDFDIEFGRFIVSELKQLFNKSDLKSPTKRIVVIQEIQLFYLKSTIHSRATYNWKFYIFVENKPSINWFEIQAYSNGA